MPRKCCGRCRISTSWTSAIETQAAAQKIVAIASVLMVAAGAACVAFGVQRMGQERVMLYDSLVRSGRTAGEAMQFDAAEQALQKAVSLYDDRLEAYVETGGPPLSAGGIPGMCG